MKTQAHEDLNKTTPFLIFLTNELAFIYLSNSTDKFNLLKPDEMKTPLLLIAELKHRTLNEFETLISNQLSRDDLSHLEPLLRTNNNNTFDVYFETLNNFERVLVNGSLTTLINNGSINVITWIS